MRKLRIIFWTVLTIVFFNLLYNLCFDFRIIKLKNNGGKKHKVGSIYYFSSIPWSVINPLKKEWIENEVSDYVVSDRFDMCLNQRTEGRGLSNSSLKGWKGFVRGKRIEIDAIKDVGDYTHVLVCIEKSESTCVFVFSGGKIVNCY